MTSDLNDTEQISDLIDDYNFSRATFYKLIQTAEKALDPLAELAQESEHPRAFEVLFKAIKDTADVNKEFMELQRRRQIIDKDNGLSTSEQIPIEEKKEQIGFSGSVDELLKQLEDSDAIDAEFEDVES